ncbi:MAG: 50S ribosomal protein L18 [bacterium]|nr:50S ribosomal protein L18 [bacterium]
MLQKQIGRKTRQRRIRAKISGTKERPRLSVFRSSSHIYAQLVDDSKGKTLASVKDLEIKKKGTKGKVELAREVGRLIAEKAKGLKIEKIVFDRGGYSYHGKVKALAEGAREGGLIF